MLGSSDQQQVAGAQKRGAIVADISREIVGIYAEFHGRGPTKAKTHWRDGLVVCVMEEVFGTAERVLVDGGRFDQVRMNRQTIRDEIEPLLRTVVENRTGRRVDTCLSQVGEDDVAVELFVLGEAPPAALSSPPAGGDRG